MDFNVDGHPFYTTSTTSTPKRKSAKSRLWPSAKRKKTGFKKKNSSKKNVNGNSAVYPKREYMIEISEVEVSIMALQEATNKVMKKELESNDKEESLSLHHEIDIKPEPVYDTEEPVTFEELGADASTSSGVADNLTQTIQLHQDDIKKEPEDVEIGVYGTNSGDSETWATPGSSKQNASSKRSIVTKKSETATSSPNKNPKMNANTTDNLTQTLKDLSSSIQILTSQNNDWYESFGKYVASMLRAMPAKKALDLQPKIVNLITSANIEENEEQISQSDEFCLGNDN